MVKDQVPLLTNELFHLKRYTIAAFDSNQDIAMQPTKQLGWGCVLVICCLLLSLNCGVELSLLVACHIGQKHEFSYWMKIARKENFSPMIKLTCRYYTWLYCSSVYAAILKKYYSWLSFHKSWQSLWSTINFKGIRIYFQFPLTKIFTAIKSIGMGFT